MRCKYCNNEIQGDSKYCPYCGNSLIDNNTQIPNQNINVNSFNQPEQYTPTDSKSDSANVGLAILSFFIPLAGLIIFLVKKDTEPKTAKVSGICALVSTGINLLVTLLVIGFTFFTANNIIDSVNDTVKENIIDTNETVEDDILEDTNETTNTPTEDETVNNNETTNNVNVSNDWKKYEVTVNNTVITIPTSYQLLKETTGFAMKSSDEKSYLESGYYTVKNLYKNDKLALYIEILNDSGVDALYSDCKVTRISQSEYQVSQGADIVYFPGGLKVGVAITEAEIIQLFGTPDDKDEYSSEGYESITYKYFENTDWTTTNNYEIKVVNGVINEIQLDHRN